MRVTQETRELTRSRILGAAHKLLSRRGFEGASTRDIADAARIASGTLFNYFATKEALVEELVRDAFEVAFRPAPGNHDSLTESLFAFVARGLRALSPHRSYISAAIVDRALNPATNASSNGISIRHLDAIRDLMHQYGAGADDPFAFHLYWSLYLGVISFWIRDESPKQEDTLALLDRSIRLFVSSLNNSEYTNHGA